MKKLPLLLLLGVFFIHAQDKRLQKAEQSYNDLNYSKASRLYSGLVMQGNDSPDIYAKLANSFYFVADYENAASYYHKLFDVVAQPEPELYFRFAQCLKTMGDYNRADAVMTELYRRNEHDARARLLQLRRNYRQEIRQQKDRFTLGRIKGNSKYSDFGTVWYGDDIVFTSTRDTGGAAKNRHGWNQDYFQEIYRASRTEEGNLEGIKKFSSSINSRYHESTASFSPDGQRIYFTRNNADGKKLKKDRKGVTRLKILTAERQPNGQWGEPEDLPFNDDGWSTAHPAVSPDGKTLYFASDMPGTKGASDIFAVTIREDGTYGIPQPLQGIINTEGRETFPYVARGKLYFASDGHPGLGGLDIYEAELLDPIIVGRVNNIGNPVNSRRDDFSFMIDSTGTFGYISSNRWGGKGADDIYAITVNETLIDIEGVIIDLETGEMLEDALVELLKDGVVVDSTYTDHKGAYLFEQVPNDGEYTVKASKKNFREKQAEVEGDGVYYDIGLEPEEEEVITRDLLEVLDFDDIYFDFDKYNIRPDAKVELDKIASYLLDNLQLSLEIMSFTDSRGSRSYNQKLSERRARATAEYLISKGVSKERIKAVGLGERHLQNECKDGEKCTQEGHQMNRRSEFYISNDPEREEVQYMIAEGQEVDLNQVARVKPFGNEARKQQSMNALQRMMIPEVEASDPSRTSEAYAVQLAAYTEKENIDLERFEGVNDLVLEKGEDGYTRLFSGIFKDAGEARAHLQQLSDRGYKGFVRTLKPATPVGPSP